MAAGHPAVLQAMFAAAMDRLGPFEPKPRIAAAVSGGADSMALAVLADRWSGDRGGALHALVVDHGLRSGSAEEARLTIDRLDRLDIAATLLPLTALYHGSALAERARIMRYEALTTACRSMHILHLLLGHHAADQVETMMMRVLARSMTHGLAAMPALAENAGVRLLRPLLRIQPDTLRHLLRDRGVAWAEDPSNRDLTALRPRLRQRLAVQVTDGGPVDLTETARTIGILRAREEVETAAELSRRATIRPEGFAVLSPGRISVGALASLLRTIGGGAYVPSTTQTAGLAACPRPATVAGVRLTPAGRLGEGLLLVREEAAIGESVRANHDTMWDCRFRVISAYVLPAGTVVGKLGPDATAFSGQSSLPSVILRTLPAIRRDGKLLAVPHLGFAADQAAARMAVLFDPRPVAGACFVPG